MKLELSLFDQADYLDEIRQTIKTCSKKSSLRQECINFAGS